MERIVQPDHVHRVVSFPPKYSIAMVVGLMKSNTGRALKMSEGPDLERSGPSPFRT